MPHIQSDVGKLMELQTQKEKAEEELEKLYEEWESLAQQIT